MSPPQCGEYDTCRLDNMYSSSWNVRFWRMSFLLRWYITIGRRDCISFWDDGKRGKEEIICHLIDSSMAEGGLSFPNMGIGNLYVQAVPPPDLNKNTSWFMYPGVWTTYILILFFTWIIVLSLFGCTAGTAWTIVNLSHFAVTYHFFHWKKGTPFSEDQGIYNKLTWWEQIDNGKQLTRNRKFLTVVPVVLYLIASHTTDYRNPWLFLNTIAVLVLVIAKFPNMHKVRIFGINSDYPI